MKSLKKWYYNLIFNLFLKKWTYMGHFISDKGTLEIDFRMSDTPDTPSRPLSIPRSSLNDITPAMNPGAYVANPKKIDAGWAFPHITLATQKTVNLYITTQDRKEYYMKNFDALRKDKETMNQYPFDLNLVMDFDVKVIGDGNGLSPEERAEVIRVVKHFEFPR